MFGPLTRMIPNERRKATPFHKPESKQVGQTSRRGLSLIIIMEVEQ
jgi:hypothetical protein